MKTDLHCHSKVSDGSWTTAELLTLAKCVGLGAIAVTNHDTMQGTEEVCRTGQALGIEVIPGMEVSAWDFQRKRKVHLLCYLPDYPEQMEQFCLPTVMQRRQAAEVMVEKVRQLYPMPPDLVAKLASGSTNIYKQHIMHAMMECGYAKEIFGDFTRKLFGKDGPAHYPVHYPAIRDAADAVRAAGGIAVLAHPFVYDSIDLMKELVREGYLDGIEVWHSRCTAEKSAYLNEFAAEHGLLMTGGSDFHGFYSDNTVPLGAATTPDDCFRALKAFKHSS